MSIQYTVNAGADFNVLTRSTAAAAQSQNVVLFITRQAGQTKKDIALLIENVLADYIKQDDVADQALV